MSAYGRGVLARWDRTQWVGARESDHPPLAAQRQAPRWQRWHWVGRAPATAADESAIGDSGLSGFGHNPNGQRWFEPELGIEGSSAVERR